MKEFFVEILKSINIIFKKLLNEIIKLKKINSKL